MIKFQGVLSEESKIFIQLKIKKASIIVAVIFACFITAVCTLPMIESVDNYPYIFVGLAVGGSFIFMIVMTKLENMILESDNIEYNYDNSMQTKDSAWRKANRKISGKGLFYPSQIIIDNDLITIIGAGRLQKRMKDVKAVFDMGNFYYVKFRRTFFKTVCVCEKRLLAKGSIAEFEELFQGKIKRKNQR